MDQAAIESEVSHRIRVATLNIDLEKPYKSLHEFRRASRHCLRLIRDRKQKTLLKRHCSHQLFMAAVAGDWPARICHSLLRQRRLQGFFHLSDEVTIGMAFLSYCVDTGQYKAAMATIHSLKNDPLSAWLTKSDAERLATMIDRTEFSSGRQRGSSNVENELTGG